MHPFNQNKNESKLLYFQDGEYFIGDNSDLYQKLGGASWAELLNSEPQYTGLCPWGKFSSDDSVYMLIHHPKYADKCPLWKLSGDKWTELIHENPMLVDRCDFRKLDDHNYSRLTNTDWFKSSRKDNNRRCKYNHEEPNLY